MRRLAPLALLLLALAPAGTAAQTARQALAAGTERYLLADYPSAASLLSRGLDPNAGPGDPLWLQSVGHLADVLLVLRQDSLAATWLRWATRLAPAFVVDEEVAPPAVVRAAAAARAFVDATPHDRFVARTTFEWPAVVRHGVPLPPGTVRLAAATIPITARIGADQFLRGGEARRLPPGSHVVVVSAPGYLPTRLTVEALPGITTVVGVSLLPETAGQLYVTARPWGTVFVDGQRIGQTSVAAHRVAPGRHTIRLQRDSAAPTDTTIVVAERQPVRLSWVGRRDSTGDARLDSALSALDAAETERGLQLLRQRMETQPRGIGLARLAEATWSLGARDSARTYLRDLVRLDPFYTPPSDAFNPEYRAAYAKVRRETPVIALRTSPDTVMTPSHDTLPIEIAVGQPGEVRLLLRLTSPRPRDSLLTVVSVVDVLRARIPLTAPDGGALAPGSYAIEGEVALARGRASDLLQLTIERLPVDTLPYVPPLAAGTYLPEAKRAGPSLHALLEGVAFGALAYLVPVLMNDSDLSGRSVPPAAPVIGASVAFASIAFNRATVPIPENVAHNQSLLARWQERNRAIAEGNATRLRQAPLRLRTTREP
ncbi:MAG: PEGA domain-containing protein [Gemmatimonadales bacterium]